MLRMSVAASGSLGSARACASCWRKSWRSSRSWGVIGVLGRASLSAISGEKQARLFAAMIPARRSMLAHLGVAVVLAAVVHFPQALAQADAPLGLVPFTSDEGIARLARSAAKVDFPALA